MGPGGVRLGRWAMGMGACGWEGARRDEGAWDWEGGTRTREVRVWWRVGARMGLGREVEVR